MQLSRGHRRDMLRRYSGEALDLLLTYASLLTSYAGNFATRREALSSTIHPMDTCDKHAKSSGISTDVATLVMFVARLRENAEQVLALRTAWESQRPSGRSRIGYGAQQRISIHMSKTKVIKHLLLLTI